LGFPLLRLLNHGDDLVQVGVITGFADLHLQASPLIDGPGNDLIALTFGYRLTLTGQHGFVQVALALGDRPVSRDFLAWLDLDQAAGCQRLYRNFLCFAILLDQVSGRR